VTGGSIGTLCKLAGERSVACRGVKASHTGTLPGHATRPSGAEYYCSATLLSRGSDTVSFLILPLRRDRELEDTGRTPDAQFFSSSLHANTRT
jgi:hypothetical protein